MALLAGATPAAGADYEARLVDWALATQQREREPSPEGKRVEEVIIAAEDVFSAEDPYPRLLNALHARTDDDVIRREVLLGEGDVWSQALADETERNLRGLFILAVVKVVPVKGRDGGVGLLVATKDRWSLRLSNAFTLVGGLLQYLALEFVEANFLGRGQRLSTSLTLRLDTVSLGQSFTEPRLFGSTLYFGESAEVVLNRDTGRPEGTAGAVTFGRPIVRLDQRWGALLKATWDVRRRRVFRGASVWQLPYAAGGQEATVPFVYDAREVDVKAQLTRSFGRRVKLDVTGVVGGFLHRYAPPGDGALEPAQAAWLSAEWLPRTEDAAYLALIASAWPADFEVLHDIESYQLSEDYQLGWWAEAGARWALPVGSAAHFGELGAAVRYRAHAAGDLFTVAAAARVRLRPGLPPANRRLALEVVNHSPPFHGGRLVVRLLADLIWDDLDHRQLLLGGSAGLRGAAADELSGRQMLLANVEYRARPFELWSTWVGLVIFYDVGAAFDARPVPLHTTGIGLRVLFPQWNREVLRLDFGFVIAGPQPALDRMSASWGQVTAIRPAFLDEAL